MPPETVTLVLYDVSHDRTRTKVADCCLDYGLARFQYSAFHGRLSRNRREQLALALGDLVEVHGGRLTIVPLCESDLAARIDIQVEPPPLERVRLAVYHGAEHEDDSPLVPH
jgi:CRISPR-associated protein Cas2